MILPRPGQLVGVAVGTPTSIGMRVPDEPWLQTLLARTGPLATTSANLSQAAAYVGGDDVLSITPDLMIESGRTHHQTASTVLDVQSAPLKVLREGALDSTMVMQWYDQTRRAMLAKERNSCA